MKAYLDIVRKVLEGGVMTPNRTGIDALTIFSPPNFEHDMTEGFPLLTTKKMAWKSARVELEGFIHGITDKKWYQDNGCRVWNEWCNPKRIPDGLNEADRKSYALRERDLGPIYGFQWRHWGAEYQGSEPHYRGEGCDQLARMVNTLKTDPYDRGMLVNSWNVLDFDKMALRPCHFNFQANVFGKRLDLKWEQRSVDVMVGLPFNIASYGLLLHLLANETGLEPGRLIGSLGNTHIYENHIENAKGQLKREPLELPHIENYRLKSIFNWNHKQSQILDYQHYDPLEFEIAV